MFVLHDRSRVSLISSSFDSNKWSGFGCRWSGGGEIRGCSYDSNGQGAWAIRKSTIKDVVRENNTVTNDFTDEQYKQVESLFISARSSGGHSVRVFVILLNSSLKLHHSDSDLQAVFTALS